MTTETGTTSDATFCWKRNLVCVWIAQVLSIMGFAFGLGFAAYYIQALGVSDPDAVKMWHGVYQAAGPLTFAIMSPIWGALGDRYGRRLMLLRANVAAAAIVFLMGWVTSVQQLIVLRLMQGVFTGTVSASLTLVATSTPKHRHGLALGSLQSAMIVGWMAGSAFGGLLADRIGYAVTVRWGGALLLTSAIIILLFVREQAVPAAAVRAVPLKRFPHFEGAIPILILFCGVALARRFDGPLLPLFIQQLNGGQLEGSATMMGRLTAICCVMAAVSGLTFGWLADRTRPAVISAVSAVLGALLAASQFWVVGFWSLTAIRASMALTMGGMETAFQVWLTRITSEERRGRFLGYSVSAKNIGWIIAALASSTLATRTGIRPVFLVEGVLLLLLVALIGWAARTHRSASAEQTGTGL